jgi:protein TonB
MLNQLLETRRARQRKPLGTVLSVLVHAVVIGVALQTAKQVATALPKPTVEIVRLPIEPKASPPVTRRVQTTTTSETAPHTGLPVPLEQVDVRVDIAGADATAPTVPIGEWRTSATNTGATFSPGTSVGAHVDGASYIEAQVEKVAAALPGSPAPAYPDLLHTAGVEGDAQVQFVVDTLGRAEPGSFRVIHSSHDAFATAVAAALPRMRFLPAEIGGRKVRMMVQQTFAFTLNHRD